MKNLIALLLSIALIPACGSTPRTDETQHSDLSSLNGHWIVGGFGYSLAVIEDGKVSLTHASCTDSEYYEPIAEYHHPVLTLRAHDQSKTFVYHYLRHRGSEYLIPDFFYEGALDRLDQPKAIEAIGLKRFRLTSQLKKDIYAFNDQDRLFAKQALIEYLERADTSTDELVFLEVLFLENNFPELNYEITNQIDYIGSGGTSVSNKQQLDEALVRYKLAMESLNRLLPHAKGDDREMILAFIDNAVPPSIP